MILTAKKLGELGKYELAKELGNIYHAELEKTEKALVKAKQLRKKNKISLDEYVSVLNRHCELFTENYHFAID